MSTMTLLQEQVDRRVLAAFTCVDALTGATITRPMTVSANPSTWTLRPNRSGIYVVFDGPGLAAQTNQFIPVGTWPAAVELEVLLQDGSQAYLPRRAKVKAPTSVPAIASSATVPNPAVAAALANPTTIFDPQQIMLYASAASATGPNWAVIRASVTKNGSSLGLQWAVLRVTKKSDGSLLASGVTDANGEAVLAVVGITLQANTTGTGPVMVSTIDAVVTAIVDPTTLNQPAGWVLDPDDILNDTGNAAFKTATQEVQLAPGTEAALSFAITL